MKTSYLSSGRNEALDTEGHVIHWARFYDAAVWILALGREKAIREMTVDIAHLQPGDKVLDVGCGTGHLTIAAKKRVGPEGRVYGIDAAPEMIDVARKTAAKLGVDVHFQAALIERLPFEDGEFDVVLSSLMIHHLPGEDLKRAAFAELHRVLKPSGRLLIVDFEPPQRRILKVLGEHLLGHAMMETNVSAYVQLLKDAGFEAIESGKTKVRLLSFVRARVGVF